MMNAIMISIRLAKSNPNRKINPLIRSISAKNIINGVSAAT